ncbi:MAG TPA: metalloregulator ArsR/SmtB family transcription factor [Anaerohalosphaeraceae bacterium]|nr:metalloregulator ArsR/SmtB family transcription factor [Anaerohalosphaeraceae bacterium]HOL31505.1 metalloregulator ArsR/SmtB family transcription factor [Anaerohalosphaeraceae bacterium]HOM75572.1 metalloregulator ArsR/SmtB family transcription factor [Anaerohalosphaeraceae bacterium]HPC64354.1 metalloregulator ArsR/SmtB family transcription factor [Anaerohalosphaeraceae bacterium]HPO69164.1 metalloregulator ArsR/SmtB family transcription factor [Anaerohalosphaeraceae bacterium]
MKQEAAILKVLADPIRLRLMTLLAQSGQLCVCQLVDALNEPQFKISRHLGELRKARLVTAQRQGTWMHYRLSPAATMFEQSLHNFFRDYLKDHPQAQQDLKRLGESNCRVPQKGKNKLKILFLCTGNSCRSQMAEGWARHLKGDILEPYSAGIETHGLNPCAVKVMAEAGVDISQHRSKHLNELAGMDFDYVITVCDNARESCPLFSGKAKSIHINFEDPPRLAKDAKTEEDALNCYRRIRDEIRQFIETLPEALTDQRSGL